MLQFSHIFDEAAACPAEADITSNSKHQTDDIPSKMTRQANAINYKVNQKALSSKRMTSQQSRDEDNDPNAAKLVKKFISMDDAGTATFIEDDMQKYAAKKIGWKKLDATTKWRAIQEYLSNAASIPQDAKKGIEARLKELLITNKLQQVTCDSANRITSLGVTVNEILL